MRTLLYLYGGERRKMLWGIVYFIIKHSPVWIMPLITARVVDIVAKPDQHTLSELWWNAAILLVVLLQNVPVSFLYVSSVSRASRSIETRLRSALCRRLQHLSIGYYTRQSAGALQSKLLRDAETIEAFTRTLYDTGLNAVVNLLGALIVTAVRAPQFLWFFAGSIPLVVVLIRQLNRKVGARQRQLRQEIEHMSGRVIEMTNLIPITRAHGLERPALDRMERSLERVRMAGLHLDEVNAIFGAWSWVSFNVFNMGTLIFAVWACWTQFMPITVGDVVMLSGYFALLTGSTLAIASAAPTVVRGFEALRSIGEVLECPDLEQNEGKEPVTSVDGAFVFENVGFCYAQSDAHAVRDFALTVAPGETIALVGPSGAGKSTVLNLVIGFVRPTEGVIRLDGRDMAELDLRTYRRWLSVVPQESILFEGTIRENVTYGLAEVSEARVQEALRDANAWEFIRKLPEGVETRVGERGARLSGGQKQRLAIARALIRDPRVLILDEATSALDTTSETLIQEALERLMRGRTTFVVAHRLSTIRNADRIVVMQNGQIVEVGPHETLLARGGLYAQLHAHQAGAVD
ncbi:MAG TPA: ABC transporter ATP-binding protein [Opitutaceae bacterium]